MTLHNRINRELLRKQIQEDSTPRTTLSFYRYVHIVESEKMRDELYRAWSVMGVLGRIYIAKEGINSQLSVPTINFEMFRNYIDSFQEFKNVPFKIAVEDDGKSFYKLTIKVRHKIVADGLNDDAYDTSNVGNHLTAEEWNRQMEKENTVVVDMRNYYESNIGHFEGALLPDVDTFRDELQFVKEELKDKKDKKILLYCTGGIRCEKASAFLKSEGFKDVNQLYGGVIDYTRQCKQENLSNKFKGKNFVFDERMAEKIGNEILTVCQQCEEVCDTYHNCANTVCHVLFIQCFKCTEKYSGACSEECQMVVNLPEKDRKEIQNGWMKKGKNGRLKKKDLQK
ncbi:MAG: rhodanese-related sulfurtransferase [Candidatus Magasanikbacteria bacterium]